MAFCAYMIKHLCNARAHLSFCEAELVARDLANNEFIRGGTPEQRFLEMDQKIDELIEFVQKVAM